MPRLYFRAFPLSLFALSFAQAADTDFTTPPRIDLLSPSASFSAFAEQFTAADLDGDGDQDLVHLPSGPTTLEGDPHAYWIENLGNRQFAALRMIHLAPTAAGQHLSKPVLWNMLGGDSKPEIFVSRLELPNLDTYQPLALVPTLTNDAPPVRIAPISLAVSSSSKPWDLVDFDGTGQAYIVQIGGASGINQTKVIARKRNGGVGQLFIPAYSVTSQYFDPQIVVDFDATDVDGDGDLDLCLACDDNVMRIYERGSNNDSQLEPRLQPIQDSQATWIDLNGDGRKDILQGDGSWYRNDGNWAFTLLPVSPAYLLPTYNRYRKVVPRAGQAALVHMIEMNEDQTGHEHIVVPFDSATPILREAAPGDPNIYATFLHYGDLDGDGHVDLVYSSAATATSDYYSRIIFTAWGSASGFSAPQPVYVGASAYSRTFAADFNGDGCPDLVSGPDALGRYRIHYNAGMKEQPLGEGELINGLEIPGTELHILGAARIDKDKYPDLVCRYLRLPVGQDYESAIVVVRGRKDGSFIPPVIPSGGLVFAPRYGLDGGGMQSENFVDWDRDGDLDLVAWGLWYENVNGSFPAAHRQLVELGTMQDFLGNPTTIGGTITGDIDGDGALDIISLVHGTGTAGQAPDHMLVAFNDGRGGIEETLELPIQLAAYDFLGNPTMTGTAVLADLNADKRLDLWVRNYDGTDIFGNPVTKDRWLRNPGRREARAMDTWVSSPLPALSAKVAPGAAFGDFDGDRKTVNLKKNLGEWLSPWGYLQSTKPGPIFSEPYDFTNGFIDLTKVNFAGGVDIDGDRDTDFILGGGGSPQIVLYNPNATGKPRPLKAKPVEWLGTLPVVR